MNWQQAYDRLNSLIEHGGIVEPEFLNHAREMAERERLTQLFAETVHIDYRAYVELGCDTAELWANGELK